MESNTQVKSTKLDDLSFKRLNKAMNKPANPTPTLRSLMNRSKAR